MTHVDDQPALAPSADGAEEAHVRYGREVEDFTAAPAGQRVQAFEKIMESHGDYLIKVCRSRYGFDRETALRMVTSTFGDAWAGLHRIQKPRTVRSWLATTLLRNCRDVRNPRPREIVGETFPENRLFDQIGSVEEPIGDSEVREELIRLVGLIEKTLPADKRRFHDLYFGQGIDGQELAAELDIKVSTAYTRIHRQKTWLAKAVEAELMVRALGHGWSCAGLSKILAKAGHRMRDTEVMPYGLRKRVMSFLDKHDEKCEGCADFDKARERVRRRWSPWIVVVPAMWAPWLLRDTTPAIEPVSHETAYSHDSRPERPVRRIRHRLAPGIPALLGLTLLLIVPSTTGADVSQGGPSGSAPATTAPGQAAPGTPGQWSSGGQDQGGARGEALPGTPGPGAVPGDVPAALIPITPPPPGVLALTPASVDLPLYGTTASVGVTAGSDMSWTATVTDPSITVAPSGGAVVAGRTIPVKITVDPKAAIPSGAGIIVTASTGQKVTVPVRRPVPGRIGVTAPRLDLGAQASTATFSVTASKGNLTWSTSSPHPALSVGPAGGSLTAGKGSLVTVRLTRPIRTGGDVPLRLTTPDGQQATVMVRWLPSPGTLRTSTGSVRIGASEFQERFTVGFDGGANTWTATVSAPGCAMPKCRLSISPASGSGSAEIIVRLEPHPSLDDPGAHSTGTITLTTPDGQRATVRVTWDPYEPG